MENVEEKELRKYCVYLITNLVNGKQYVGQTCIGVEGRWKEHLAAVRRGLKRSLYYAIKKYGIRSFRIDTLAKGLTLEEANQEEIWIVRVLDLTSKKFGYNMTKGGGGVRATEEMNEKRCKSRGWKKDPLCGNRHFAKQLPTEIIIQEYRSGLSTYDLAEKYGVSPPSMTRRLAAAGEIRSLPEKYQLVGKKLSDRVVLPIKEIRKEYESGTEPPELGLKYGCSGATIRGRLEENGTKMRTRSEAQRIAAPKRARIREDVPDKVILRLDKEGWSSREIGEAFNMSHKSILHRLNKSGIERESRGTRPRTRKFKDRPERNSYIRSLLETQEGVEREVHRSLSAA